MIILKQQKDNKHLLDLEYVQLNVPKVLGLLKKVFAKRWTIEWAYDDAPYSCPTCSTIYHCCIMNDHPHTIPFFRWYLYSSHPVSRRCLEVHTSRIYLLSLYFLFPSFLLISLSEFILVMCTRSECAHDVFLSFYGSFILYRSFSVDVWSNCTTLCILGISASLLSLFLCNRIL